MADYHNDRLALDRQPHTSLDDEYIAAQRAAFESILIGRETAQTIQQQGEQLERSEAIADETQYKLDRATRLLKGMTWSGWVNNLFTSLPQIPPLSSSSQSVTSADKASFLPSQCGTLTELSKYDNIPSSYNALVQCVKNYHANVTILQCCETYEQKETCKIVCNEMYNESLQLINQYQTQTTTDGNPKQLTSVEAYIVDLTNDLEKIRKQQLVYETQAILISNSLTTTNSSTNKSEALVEKEKEELFGRKSMIENKSEQLYQLTKRTVSPPKCLEEQKQDEHLKVLASSLNELGSIAQSLHSGLHEQNKTIESLEVKSDQVYETSKMVTRRANRLIQDKSWTQSPSMKQSIFISTVSIRHIETGKYLAVMGNDLYLVNRYNKISCTYDIYKRYGNIIGINAHANHKWIGQSFLTGSITCSSSTFGKREEWETEDSSTWTIPNATTTDSITATKNTRLLCVSAGWGQGGYIQVVNGEEYSIRIGGITVEDTKNAAQWAMTPLSIGL